MSGTTTGKSVYVTLDESDERVRILYTNYKGEVSWRTVRPLNIMFTSNQWHPEPQWIMEAFDYDKGAVRSFAMKDIHRWEADPCPT